MVFNAWNLHIQLCENARSLRFKSVFAQVLVWMLALTTTTIAITIGSFGTGHNPDGAELMRHFNITEETTAAITDRLGYAALLLPIASALATTLMAKMMWRDKYVPRPIRPVECCTSTET